jgi:hypothetical protein
MYHCRQEAARWPQPDDFVCVACHGQFSIADSGTNQNQSPRPVPQMH